MSERRRAKPDGDRSKKYSAAEGSTIAGGRR
jgi:hypothetical protein